MRACVRVCLHPQGSRQGFDVLETFFLNLFFVTFPLNFLVNTVRLMPQPVRAPPRSSSTEPLT